MGSVRCKGHTWFSLINLTHSWSIWGNRFHGSIIHQPTSGCFMYLSVNGEGNNDDSNDARSTLKIAIMVIFFLKGLLFYKQKDDLVLIVKRLNLFLSNCSTVTLKVSSWRQFKWRFQINKESSKWKSKIPRHASSV